MERDCSLLVLMNSRDFAAGQSKGGPARIAHMLSGTVAASWPSPCGPEHQPERRLARGRLAAPQRLIADTAAVSITYRHVKHDQKDTPGCCRRPGAGLRGRHCQSPVPMTTIVLMITMLKSRADGLWFTAGQALSLPYLSS